MNEIDTNDEMFTENLLSHGSIEQDYLTKNLKI